jgi:hypothetical protein
MKKTGVSFVCLLFIFGLAQSGAQTAKTDDVPIVLAGIFRALEYVLDAEEETGDSFDLSLSWEKFPDNPDACGVVFSNFRYIYGIQRKAYRSVILNGKLTCDDSGRMNGSLSVGGKMGVSSMRFDNLGAWESSETGGVTVDGVSYTQEELTKLIDDMDEDFDTREVMSWEMECLYAGMMTLIESTELEWEDGGGVFDSLGDPQGLPPNGGRVSGEDGKISAVVKEGGIGFSYRDFPVRAGGYLPLFTVRGDVFISARLDADGDIESMTFNGDADIQGLPDLSRVELNGFTIEFTASEAEDRLTGSGSVVINGKHYLASKVLDSLVRWIQ